MPRPKGGRRQPRMPNITCSRKQLQQTKSQADPTSPPHTPTASPQKARKTQPAFAQASRSSPMDPRIQPIGSGHQFSYQPFIVPEQLSPDSPSSSEPADDADEDDYSSEEEEVQQKRQTGPIKAPSPLAASDAQSSEDDSDSDEEEEEEEEDDDEEEEDDEEEQDSALREDAAMPSVSQIGNVVQMEDEDEEEEEEEEEDDEEVEEDELGDDAAMPSIPPVGHVVQMEDEDEEEEDEDEEEDEEVEDSALREDAAMPSISPVGNVVQMEDDDEEEEDEEEDDEDDEDGDDEDEDEEEEDGSDNDEDGMPQPAMESPVQAATTSATTTVGDFVLEDMDPMDSDNGLSILDPYEVESNRSLSNRSRSSSKHRDDNVPHFEHRDLPIRMMQDMKNLQCSHEASDEEAEAGQDSELAAFLKHQRNMRNRRLSISSSIGKRTFSERSDSDDSDSGGLDVNEAGSTARRMRKRMHRGSLLFQDPPEPRIDELEEPNSSEDEYLTTIDHLGMELPYWPFEINEVEDSQ